LTNFGIGVWIFQKTGSATSFALAMVATSLPGVILSPIAGALVDRWNRRTAMIVSDIGAGLASLALVLLVLAGTLDLWKLYGLMAVSSAFTTLMWPAINASTSLLVPKEHLGRANGLLQGAEAASMLVTPVLGALLYVSYGLKVMVGLDVASFVIAVFTLLLVRIPSPAPVAVVEGVKPSFLKEVTYGFTYINQRRGLLGLLIFFLSLNFILGFINVLWTPLILTLYNPKILGQVESFIGLGALLGTIFMSVWGGPKRRILGVLGFGAIGGACTSLVGLPPSWPLYAMAGALMLFFMPVVSASSQAIWQVKVEPSVQGRVFAVRRMIAWCTTPLASLVAGPVTDRIFEPGMRAGGALTPFFGFLGTGPGAGIRLIFVFVGIGTVAIAAAAYASPKVRNVETDLPDAVTEEVVAKIEEEEQHGNSLASAASTST
jgi:DHA3 family macrolide efflux protein-like MFS transporter